MSMRLRYESPLADKYAEFGDIIIVGTGTTADGHTIATMVDTDTFCEFATFKHGSDGGGLQMEIDEIGAKMVSAYNAHDDLLASCEAILAWALKHDQGHEGSELLEILSETHEAVRKAVIKAGRSDRMNR